MSFLHFLDRQEEMLKGIESKRIEYGIPKNGISIKKELVKNFRDLNNVYLVLSSTR